MIFLIITIVWALIVWVLSCLTTEADYLFFMKKRVYFLDSWGEIRDTGREVSPGLAYLYGFSRIRLEHLNKDGTVRDPTSYLTRWSYTKEGLK